jgi:hypothetical protein
MRVAKPTLHPMVKPALLEIQSAGIDITPEIVVWLQDAANSIAKTAARPCSDVMDWPTPCGGALLYPLSFGAIEWISKLPHRLQNDCRVIGFACANVKTPEVFVKLNGVLPVTIAVLKWMLRLTCSPATLERTIDIMLGCGKTAEVEDHTGKRKSDDDWQWGATIKALCVKYPGTTPDYWIWQVSREKACYMLSVMQHELPDDLQFTDHEINATNEFRSIVESLKAGKNG